MKLDPKTPFGNRALSVAAWLAQSIIQLLGRSCRVDVVEGAERLDALCPTPDNPQPQPVLLCYWHNRAGLAAPLFYDRLVQRGADITMLASQSRDGELVSRMAREWRMRQVRGSATRGGAQALRALYRVVTRDRSSPVMLPDGPHGPRYEFKVGVAVLAQMSQAPILPMGLAVSRAWRLGSWDRLILPKPFARLVVIVGEPQMVLRGLDADALEAERARLERLINDLTERATSMLGTGS